MAYSDFDFYDAWRVNSNSSNTIPVSDFAGGAPGGASILHSTLSSPLVGEGTYCRNFTFSNVGKTVTNSDAGHTIRQGFVKPSSMPTLSNPLPENSAVSIRAWVRHQIAASQGNGSIYEEMNGVGLVAKGQVRSGAILTGSNTTGNTGSYDNLVCNSWGGYRLELGTIAPRTSLQQYSGNYQASTGVTVLQLSAFNSTGLAAATIRCSGSYSSNVWYRLRLDVSRNGSSGDIITAYVESPANSGNWSQVGQIVLDTLNSGYRSWGNVANRYGLYTMGCVLNTGPSYSPGGGYFDKFQFFHDLV